MTPAAVRPAIRAVAQGLPPARGPVQPSGQAVLYGILYKPDGRIVRVRREVSSGCGCENKRGAITQELLDRVRNALAGINAHLRLADANVQNVRLNFTSGRVKWIDGNSVEQGQSFSNVQHAALRSGLLDLSKDVVHRSTTDPNVDSNRPMNRGESLEKPQASWAKAHSNQSGKEYLTDDFTELEAAMAADHDPTIRALASHAPAKVKASETFRNAFIAALTEKKTICETERDRLQGLPGDNRTQILAKIRQIRELDKQIKKLRDQLDTKVIRHNVAFTNNDLSQLSPAERRERSKKAKTTMSANLTKRSSGWFSPQLADGMAFWKSAPDATFKAAYENDTEDMFYHDRWAYEQRVQDRGGRLKGASTEEFIYHNIETLGTANTPNDDAVMDEAMKSLSLPSYEAADTALRNIVKEALQAARNQTLAEYQYEVPRTTAAGQTVAQKAAILFP